MTGSSSTISTVFVMRALPVGSVVTSEASHEIPPLSFGLVQGVVGALDQVGDAPGVVGKARDAEARRQWSVRERVALDDRAHALGVDERRRLGRARKQRDELVTALSGHDRVASQLARQELHDLLEDLVAGAVAPAVVDGLEAVEIEQDERQRLLVAGGAAHLFVQPQHEIAPVVAVRERVLERELLEPGAPDRERAGGGERTPHLSQARVKRNRLPV